MNEMFSIILLIGKNVREIDCIFARFPLIKLAFEKIDPESNLSKISKLYIGGYIMKKIYLVARQNVHSVAKHELHDDKGLECLDGIRYGKPKYIDDNINPLSVADDLKLEFENDNVEWYAAKYSIRFEDGSEIEI